MKKISLLLGTTFLVVILAISITVSPADATVKVTICHKGNNGVSKTIEVPEKKVQDHLDHGDTLGPCEIVGDEQEVTQMNYQEGFLNCNEANPDAEGVLYLNDEIGNPDQLISQCNGIDNQAEPDLDPIVFDPPRPISQITFTLGCNDGKTFKDETFTLEQIITQENDQAEFSETCNLPGKGTTSLGYIYGLEIGG